MVLRLNQETRAPHHLVHGADLCLTIPGPLHRVSYSCLISHRCPPGYTCHLHTSRQANTFLHMKQIVGWNHRNFPDSNSNQGKLITHHKSNLGTNHMVSHRANIRSRESQTIQNAKPDSLVSQSQTSSSTAGSSSLNDLGVHRVRIQKVRFIVSKIIIRHHTSRSGHQCLGHEVLRR
jgi:hypothetical protein